MIAYACLWAGAFVLAAVSGALQRLVRLEQLVLLIAQQVGVPPEAIERLLPAPLPPT